MPWLQRTHSAELIPPKADCVSIIDIDICVTSCLLVYLGYMYLSHFVSTPSYGDVSITGEGLQILTFARHLPVWSLSSDGSFACHIFCGSGHPLIMVIYEGRWHSYLLPSVWQWSCQYSISDLDLSRLGFKHLIFRLPDERSDRLCHCHG